MIHEYIWGTEDWIYQDKGLLIKRIDAKDKLSVQVHPNDEYAHEHGLDNGKTECWYITKAQEGAFLYCGFKKAFDTSAALDGTIEEYLMPVYVKPGDFIFIPAGTVHAIGAGIKLIEIQQDSTTTYRLYDYKRKGPDGKERELHVTQALQCIDANADCGLKKLPFSCDYFSVEIADDGLHVFSDAADLTVSIE